ncbi:MULTISPECIES: FkbM family methyltransferase [Aphanothece]|uniref:FkbM family methyltransferase n=1 Tax=Aphanothece TaxID=1121 RepID=UPI0039846AA2
MIGLFDSSERFLRFCEAFQHLTNSQSLQDLFALYCKGPGPGYFLEFGLANGTSLSNTLLLELLGWKGLGGEPNPVLRELAQARRSIPVVAEALYATSGDVLHFACNGLYGGLEEAGERLVQEARAAYTESIEVQTITLGDLLDREKAPKRIDYFSLDVEGAEEMILSHLPLDRYRFACLTVEHNYSAQRPRIRRLMKQQGFQRVFRELSGHDDWYVNSAMRFRGWPQRTLRRLNDERGRIHLARCQAGALDDRDKAIATLHATVLSRPRPHPRSFLELASLLLQAERPAEARQVLERARQLHPANARIGAQLEQLE